MLSHDDYFSLSLTNENFLQKSYLITIINAEVILLTIEFFIPMVLPTITHQQKKISVKNGKPIVYEPPELADARQKFMAHLAKYTPGKKLTGALQLITKWCYDNDGTAHADGEYKITKPDTDNMIKLLKDVMTELGFWKDDCLVSSEVTEKFWAKVPGLYVRINKL